MDEIKTKLNKAQNLISSNRFEEAIVILNEILKKNPWNWSALSYKRSALFHGNEGIIKYYDGKIKVLEDEDMEAYCKDPYPEARKYQQEQDRLEHLQDIEDGVIEDDTHEPTDEDYLGKEAIEERDKERNREKDEIINKCNEILTQDPKNIRALYNMNKRLHVLNRHREAFNVYDKIVAINPIYIDCDILEKQFGPL